MARLRVQLHYGAVIEASESLQLVRKLSINHSQSQTASLSCQTLVIGILLQQSNELINSSIDWSWSSLSCFDSNSFARKQAKIVDALEPRPWQLDWLTAYRATVEGMKYELIDSLRDMLQCTSSGMSHIRVRSPSSLLQSLNSCWSHCHLPRKVVNSLKFLSTSRWWSSIDNDSLHISNTFLLSGAIGCVVRSAFLLIFINIWAVTTSGPHKSPRKSSLALWRFLFCVPYLALTFYGN